MIELLNRYKLQINNVGIYLSASMIVVLLGLITNPFIAMNMEPEDYAIVGYYSSFNKFLSPFILFFLIHYYNKKYFELSHSERLDLKATIIKSMLFFSFLLALISLLIVYIYIIYFNVESTIRFFPYALLSVFSIPLTGIYTLMLTDYKMQRESKSFFNLTVTNGVIGIGLALLLVVLLKFGALGRMTAIFLTNAIIFSWCLYKNANIFKHKFDWTIFRNMLKFTWPLTIAGMLGFFSNGYDRVFLERLGNTKELGFYVVAVQMASYIAVFTTAIASTFQPDIYEGIIKRNLRKTIITQIIIIGSSCFVIGGFIALAPYIIDILTAGRYTYSAKYARVLALAQIILIMYYSVSTITIALGLTPITLINKIFGSLVSVAIFSYLITKWQFMGAAWGQVLSYTVFLFGNLLLIFFWRRNKNKIEHART